MNRVLFTIAMLLTPVCARPPAAQFGPRVSLSGELPLSTALLRLGRQLNRRFWGPPLNRSETARRSYAWHLDNATVADTLDAIRQTTGFEVRRGSRYYYQLDEQGPRGSIGQPLGDFRVWLPAVRMFFSSYLYPAYADRVYQRLSVSPLFLVEAPCDPEALAREAFLLASAKLPLRTTFVSRLVGA